MNTASASSAKSPSRLTPKRVLFIGNSYTFFNDLPRTVMGLAASAQPPVKMNVRQTSFGGVSLKEHWTGQGIDGRFVRTDGLRAIRQGGLDYVVLQDRSTQSLEDPDAMFEYIGLFAGEIRAVGAKPLLYMTWARQNEPEMIDTTKTQYLKAAKAFDIRVAPVGIAWANSLKARPDMLLHIKDLSHPSAEGSYLAACVLYASLTERSPVGLTPRMWEKAGSGGLAKKAILDSQDADFLQSIAWSTVKSFSVATT